MRVMVFAKATEDSEKGAPPPLEAFEAMERFTEDLVRAGVLVAGAGLKNSAQARRIVFDGPGHTVAEGPFGPPQDLVAGFSIWEVENMDEAVAWARRSPRLGPGRTVLEIRPFIEVEDMAEALGLEAPEAEDGERGKLGVA